MKIQIDGKDVYELSEFQEKIICCFMNEKYFYEDMKNRINYLLNNRYEECFKKLKNDWEPRLSERYDSLPTNREKLADLIFSQPDYKIYQ